MAVFQVEINGQNFLIEFDGKIAKYGFFSVRLVEASTPADAESAAVQMIRETQHLRDIVRNTLDDPPLMDVVQIAELDSLVGIDEREPGVVWYPENPRRWWQLWKR
jgi:hypothetical protein